MDSRNHINKCGINSLISGLIFGIILAKGGNPVIFADKIPPPQNFWEVIFSSFPITWILILLGITLLLSIFNFNFKMLKSLPWFSYLLFLWFLWQVIASFFTIDLQLTKWAILHFSACIVCFLIGYFNWTNILKPKTYFWVGIGLSFLWIIYNGFDQRFGGLETIRANFEQLLAGLPPEQRLLLDTYEFRVKIMSNRIFSVFVYPNAFAGALLLLTPPLVWRLFEINGISKMQILRWVLIIVLIIGSISCLYWTGSKAGWMVLAIMFVVLLWRELTIPKITKIIIGISVVVVLCAALFIRHSDYFQKGAKSIGARLDYWSAAMKIALNHPVFGTGPGTFSRSYKEIKNPESEMARLAHNDYLEQASDSGLIGFIAYTGFVVGTLFYGYRKSKNNNMLFMIWLGVFSLNFHSLLEFHLYIPSLAWTNFLFIGVVYGVNPEICSKSTR